MHIIRFFRHSLGAVAIIICLLIVQATTDLSLPHFTSQIVDVGIQQSGIEHAAPDELTAKTYDEIAMMLSPQDEQTFRFSYDKTDKGTYRINSQGKSQIKGLDSLVATPLVVIHYAPNIPNFNLDEVMRGYVSGAVTKNQILDTLSEAKAKMGNMSDSIINQQAIAATKAEYKSLGYDLSNLQMTYLMHTGFIMLGLSGLGMVMAVLVGFIASRMAAMVAARLRSRLFDQVVRFSDAEVQSFSAASLITRATNDVQLVQTLSVILLRLILYAPILAIGGIIMVAQTDLSMSWVIALAVGIIFIIIFVLMKVAMPKFKIMQKLIDRVNLVAREILTGVAVIRAFDRQPFEEHRFDQASTSLMKTQLFTNRVMTFMFPLMMLILNAVSVLIVWVGGSFIDNGTIQTGDLIAFITYAMLIIMGFLMMGMMSIMLPRADVAAIRIQEVLNKRGSIQDPDPICSRDEELQHAKNAKIAFNEVSFKYGNSEEYVLQNISFVCEPGKTTALIGSTGAGKSTILKLIERFYDVSEGSITFNDVDIRKFSQKALRAQFGYVPQKGFLFSGTIASNIAYSDKGMKLKRIQTAADIAQARDFIDAKDQGMDAAVSSGGTNVSGGQRQRLAIARALAADAKVYLFDDSFSALDYKTDAALRQALKTNLSNKTIIIVAQRISTIMHADNIVVLDDGRVKDQGTHHELLKTSKEYREIALSQLSEKELNAEEAS